jgi:hypothetical protein
VASDVHRQRRHLLRGDGEAGGGWGRRRAAQRRRDRTWGQVTVWQPPTEFAYTSNPGLEPDVEPSLVSAHFAPAAKGGTVFDFAHGGWTESNAGTRGKFTEWRNTLDRFAAAADRIS